MPRKRKNDSNWGWIIGLGTIGIIGYRLLKTEDTYAYPTKEPNPDRKRNEKLHTQEGPSEPDLKPRKIGTTSFPLTERKVGDWLTWKVFQKTYGSMMK